MKRSKGVLFAAGILFLIAAWFLIREGLAFWGVGEVAAVPEGLEGMVDWEEWVRRRQIASAMAGPLTAGILILVGTGIYSLAGWSRPLGLVVGFWWGILSLVGLFAGEGLVRLRVLAFLLVAILLIWTLSRDSVKVDLSPRDPRPRSLTVLGVLYFIQAILVAEFLPLVLTPLLYGSFELPPLILVGVFLVLALSVSVALILVIGLLELRSWARTLTLIFAGIAVSVTVLSWVILLARDPSEEAVGRLVAQSLIGFPISVFALWCLTRSHVKERFLVPL